MPKIFISYGRDQSHGQNLATEAQQQLQAAGFDVFRDVIGLKPGDVWYSKLEFELDSSDLVVLVVSEKIRHSEWVHNEISMAKEIGLPIIPVIAEQVRMPLWLRHLQTLDFTSEANWEALLDAINQLTKIIPKPLADFVSNKKQGGELLHDGELYSQAVEVVMELDQVSTSHLQNQLRIEHDKALWLMEMLEERAIVGSPNSDGLRIVLACPDDLYGHAVSEVIKSQRASVSYLQRSLEIDYNRAALLLDHMERVGIVSEVKTNGVREVLHSSDELYSLAVDIVVESQRASISHLQRRLKVGYNRASQLISHMEKVGIVSKIKANGVREVLRSNDELYCSAVDVVIESQRASVSYLQRRLKIGYNRASLLIDHMEKVGIVSEIKANGVREVVHFSDELYNLAVDIVVESQRASISYLQRRLKIGYDKAARLMDRMERLGVVSKVQENGLRSVLHTL